MQRSFDKMKIVSCSGVGCSAPAVLAPHWILAWNKNQSFGFQAE